MTWTDLTGLCVIVLCMLDSIEIDIVIGAIGVVDIGGGVAISVVMYSGIGGSRIYRRGAKLNMTPFRRRTSKRRRTWSRCPRRQCIAIGEAINTELRR